MNHLSTISIPHNFGTEYGSTFLSDNEIKVENHADQTVILRFSDGKDLEFKLSSLIDPFSLSTTSDRIKWLFSSASCAPFFMKTHQFGLIDRQLRARRSQLAHLVSQGVYVYGTGIVGRQVNARLSRNSIKVESFVTTNGSANAIDGLRDQAVHNLPREATVVIGSGRFGIEIEETLRDLGFASFITLPELELLLDSTLSQSESLCETLVGKTSDWWKLALLLNDTQSVITLQSLLSFRLSLNLKELKSVIVRDHQQWFCDDFVDASSIDVFIDCGAFDGDTIESFINQTNDYSMIVGFEPSRKNFNLASARHKNEKIRLRNIVLSDSKGHVLFEDSDLMDASASDSPKAVYVESNYLDDELLNLLQNNQRIYLKIDVEGSESKLINGSKSLRTRYRPIIGIAAYHYWSDLFSLPFQLVTDAGPCSIGLRHYTESHFESVLYLCSQ